MEKEYPTKYPSDVSDEEWAFVAPYLTLCREDAPQREHALRAVFNGLRYIVRTGNQWRFMPGDLPPWTAVYQQTQRWMRAGVFEILVEDVRSLLREFAGRKPQPTAMIVDSRTLQSTPESGARAGYDGAKRRKGSKVHAAVDTLGHLLALHVTAASEQDRAQELYEPKPIARPRTFFWRRRYPREEDCVVSCSFSLAGSTPSRMWRRSSGVRSGSSSGSW